MNRAARRHQAKTVEFYHSSSHRSWVLPLELAIELNNEVPSPGLAEVLHSIRAEVGLHVIVELCFDCAGVEVLR